MTDGEQSENELLEAAMDRASLGYEDAVEVFYKTLLAGPLFVPERYQAGALSDAPEYPNDFVNVLGVQDKERVVVPAFSHKSYINEWCGADLAATVLSGAKLLELMPRGWWLVVNPGRTVEKEISPWEIDQLRGGEVGIAAVMEELKSEKAAALSLRPVADEDLVDLKGAVREAAQREPSIKRLFLMREEGFSGDGEHRRRLLLGAEAPECAGAECDRLRDELQRAAAPHLIGGDPISVIVEQNVQNSMLLGLFQHSAPIYQAQEKAGWWRRLLSRKPRA